MAEQFHAQQLALATEQARNPLLAALNAAGQQAFAAASVPNRKTEAWKYTSLHNLLTGDFQRTASQSELTAGLREVATLGNLKAARLVFINGRLSSELSDALALQQVTLFSQADAEQQVLISQHLGTVLAQASSSNSGSAHLFNDLNNAALNDGVLIHVGKNQRLEQPLQISWLSSNNPQPFSITSRMLMVLESGAEATLVEHYASDEQPQNSFTNALSELVIGDNARLQHYRLQLMQEDALHIGSTHVDLARDSQYNAFHLGLGTRLTRNDIVVNHNVSGSHCELNGVYIPQNQQLLDFHTCIEHKVPHCTSNEVFRGIMNDKARAVFNGRIHIHPQAQKTLAELSNKNLLLTNTAEIYTKPELEIYADDVKCAHGATVAQLEEKAMFYMQSRGISKKEAEVMLSFGFINELLEALPHEDIALVLRPLLARRFGRDQSLSRHLLENEAAGLSGEDA
ncbi:Fe-S cluster assembly protein SufD [Thalassolituus hydrocarboniclasticus]|uniref:Fe-S cluster assembly protein SufD n=1 Tax=Thalassolituus hydrocarboniclasticus TaxID=2742796 RepID=A0ABY6AAI8_9GAMM|nr:Fe-S cluster assembly protein SufD [Thalassolituus hydrocarboniclasticus]UXD88041.1 Fe-S cluster assembly protein SufD [Thalassolituus hydrocarboniclasticus]